MTDELIRELRRDWQSQEYDASSVVKRLRRARWAPHLVLASEILGYCVALGVGIWFAWVAVHQDQHKLLFVLSAAVLLITALVEGQPIKVVTRTDFTVNPGQPLWLLPEPDKLRWLRASDGVAIDQAASTSRP